MWAYVIATWHVLLEWPSTSSTVTLSAHHGLSVQPHRRYCPTDGRWLADIAVDLIWGIEHNDETWSKNYSCLQVLGRFNRARAARLTLPHFTCQTPLFMPVGTQGIVSVALTLVQSEAEFFLCKKKKKQSFHVV